ncbi:hypothetical protein M3Y98_01152900 [Aphelenchoides besseyi]|nr:hypothetical protein M3Y98_01152900 [Aphelenchoides besseyi]
MATLVSEIELEICRPIKLHYHFALYENNEIVGSVMEDMINNPNAANLLVRIQFPIAPKGVM